MLFRGVLFLAIGASLAIARSASSAQNSIDETPRSEPTSYLSELRSVYKIYQECSSSDLSSCLKLKLIAAMDRVARTYNEISLMDGVNFVKTSESGASPAISESELDATLPRATSEREDALNTLLVEKVSDFFETHTLQVKLPTSSELQRSLDDEGRAKRKKMSGLLLLPLILGGTLIPIALGALALLAGKALIVSKLALVLAAIIGLKKLLGGSSNNHHDSGHEVYVASGGGHGSGYARSYDKEEAQNLAYSAYASKAR